MPYRKKTKIIATLGPATNSKEIMKKMMDAGVDVFRINFSHANHEEIKTQIKTIRSLNEEFGYNTA
ncbi:MAG: pyruvate kinase, partial [Sinomicrobium sp.]|nr:pyruvate kinase [Sinomicrobium sp.]